MKKKSIIANRKRTYRLFFLLLCTFYLITCSISDGKLSEENAFIDITAQIMTIEKLEIPDSGKALLTKDLFSKRKMSIKTYRQLQDNYMRDAAHWKILLERVKKDLEKKQISTIK